MSPGHLRRPAVPPPRNPLQRAWWSFRPVSMPAFARRNYQHELSAMGSWPIAVTMIEGAVVGVIAEKAFDQAFPGGETPAWIIATLAAAPAFSSITSFVWTRFADGHRVVKALVWIKIAVLACLLLIAMVPVTELGLYLFTLAAVMSRVGMTGVITLRSVLWRANYERHERARITGKLITLQTLLVAVVGMVVGWLMDVNEQAFRLLFPVSILFGLLGVYSISRLRVRRPHLVTPKTGADLAPSDQGGPAVVGDDDEARAAFRGMLTRAGRSIARAAPAVAVVTAVPVAGTRAVRSWGTTIRDMAAVLRADAAFRGYMIWMFVLGLGNLSVLAPLVRLLDNQFENVRLFGFAFTVDYFWSLMILQTIPMVMIPITIPTWARLLDRVHIIRFRALHAWVFVAGQAMLAVGAATGSFLLIFLAAFARGAGFGGGSLAWNIGHNDFATSDKAGLYMTIHVTLTGVRGLIGSFFGMLLYEGLRIRSGAVPIGFGGHGVPIFASDQVTTIIPAMEEFAFTVFFVVTAIGAFGFMGLERRFRSLAAGTPHD